MYVVTIDLSYITNKVRFDFIYRNYFISLLVKTLCDLYEIPKPINGTSILKYKPCIY